jgi:hypothetical protein
MRGTLSILILLISQILLCQSIEKKLEHHQSYPLEKLYISHNQPFYAPGDTLYGKLFMVNGRSHQYFKGSPIVYIDWIREDGTFLDSLIIKVEKGVADLTIPIRSTYKAGRYLLRAYTQYQKNFDIAYIFQKEIKIIGEKPLEPRKTIGKAAEIDLQFFPEGGHAIAGLNNRIAFKAVNGKGEPIAIEGQVLNKKQQVISEFKSINEGIGIIKLNPQIGEKYQAKVHWKGKISHFDLPQSLKQGYVLKANNRKEKSLSIYLRSNTKTGLKDCRLIAHVRGQVFLNQQFTKNNEQKLMIDKTKIPSGVLHFTLFDAKDRPVCERLVFNENPTENVSLDIELPQNTYGVKDLVNGNIKVKMNGKEVKGDMSMTVYNQSLFSTNNAALNIKSYLLLQSDLRGNINNIAQYFKANDTKSRTLLDYVMLTHGWRRFNWQDVLLGTEQAIIYPTEEQISFAGKVKRNNKKGVAVKADVFLSILDEAQFASANLTTEADGLFHFKGFDLPDSCDVLIQGNIYNAKKKKRLKKGEAKRIGNKQVKFELLKLHQLDFNKEISLKSLPYNRKRQQLFAKEVNRVRKIDTIYHPEWKINLDAVTVKGQKIDAKRQRAMATKQFFKERGYFYSDFSEKVYMEDVPAKGAHYLNIYEFIRDRVKGAQIFTIEKGGVERKVVQLRGQSSFKIPTYATFEVDGVIVSSLTAESLVLANIEMVDVKRGLAATSIYGEVGKGGIITIITREPKDHNREIKIPGILTIQHPGYHKARTFYTPNYAKDKQLQEKPDYRSTLYWNPSAKIEAHKSTPFSFYTGDKLDKFLILVEGITEEGVPFVGQQSIRVERGAN